MLGPFWGVESLGGVSTEERVFSGVSWLLNSRLQTVSDKEPQGSSLTGECLGVFVLTFENSGASFLTAIFLSVHQVSRYQLKKCEQGPADGMVLEKNRLTDELELRTHRNPQPYS